MADIFEALTEFAKAQKEETERALQTEENQVCIKPDSYIAKEIKYQTAILHQVSNELRNLCDSEKKKKRKAWFMEPEEKQEKYVLESTFLEQMTAETWRCTSAIGIAKTALLLSGISIAVIIGMFIKIFLLG